MFAEGEEQDGLGVGVQLGELAQRGFLQGVRRAGGFGSQVRFDAQGRGCLRAIEARADGRNMDRWMYNL